MLKSSASEWRQAGALMVLMTIAAAGFFILLMELM